MSDWIKLSVGGTPFETTRLTLTSCPDSQLAAMFAKDSDRWDLLQFITSVFVKAACRHLRGRRLQAGPQPRHVRGDPRLAAAQEGAGEEWRQLGEHPGAAS